VKKRPSRPTQGKTRAPERPAHAPLLFPAGLAAAGLVVFASALNGPFLFDDEWAVLNNPHVRAVWPLSASMAAPAQTPLAGRPVPALSFAISYALGGLDPWGYHLWNLGVHILAALVLFGIVRRTCLLPRVPEPIRLEADQLAFVVALLWLVHPLQTEVVNYLTQRTESTVSLFYLLTLYTAIRAMSEPLSQAASRWIVASVLACGLGMASKETMATAPVAVFLYDVVFAAGSPSKAVRDRWRLYGGLALTWGVLGWLVADGPRWRTAGFSAGVSPWTYLLHQPGMIVTYLKLVVWPSPLVFDYGRTNPITFVDAALALAVVLALIAATAVGLWRRLLVGYLGAWFWITLSPSSSIVPIASEVGAERRMYLPLAAVIVLLSLGARWAIRRALPDGLVGRRARVIAVAVTCIACVGLTVRRNLEYRSELAIWQTVLDRRPHPRAHYNIAAPLSESGRVDDALEHYRAAVDEEPEASYALGFELEKRGRLNEAAAEYARYLERQSDGRRVLPARIRLGVTLMQIGRLPEAATSLEAAVRLAPNDPDAVGAYGHALAESGRLSEAVRVFERLVTLTPDDADAYQSLGLALLGERRAAEAVAPLQRAVALAPQDDRKQAMLGSTLLTAGRTAEGLVALERAFALGYNDPALRAAYDAARRP